MRASFVARLVVVAGLAAAAPARRWRKKPNPARQRRPSLKAEALSNNDDALCVTGSDVARGGAIVERIRVFAALDFLCRAVFSGCYASPAPAIAMSPTAQSLKFLVAGAVGGVASRTLVSPLEVIATIRMASEATIQDAGVLDALVSLWAAEGLLGFFKGNGANCLKVAPTKGIQFVVFECLKRLIVAYKKRTRRQEVDLDAIDRLIAGGCAGMVAAAFVYPLETVKSVLTVERARYGACGVWTTLRTVANDRGVFALYKGLIPTLLAMFPYVGVEFCVYETIKVLYLQKSSSNDSKRLTTLETMLIGAFSGALAQTSCHPLDVVRKRLQLQGIAGRPSHYANLFDGLRGIARAEGVAGLYKGLKPACLATLPSTGSSYVVYEFVKRLLGVASK